MKTKVLLFSLMFVMSQQVFGYTIKTDTVVIHYEKYQLEQIIVSINNTDDEPLWIWLDETGKYQNEKKAIKYYLMDRHGFDFSIYDIGTEAEMDGCWWDPDNLYFAFIKYLEPGKFFTIVLYREIKPKKNYFEREKNEDCIESEKEFIEKHKSETYLEQYREKYFEDNKHIVDVVKIYTDRQIDEYCPGIDREYYGVKRISYPHDIITCPIKAYQHEK